MLCWHFWHQYGLFTHHLKAKLNPSVSLAPHYVCFDLGFTLEKNLTSSVSLLPPARVWGSFSWEMAPSTGELHTLNFPLLLCSPCPHTRMEQPSMKGLWQLHLGMRSHFTMVAAELARTFPPLYSPVLTALLVPCLLEQAWHYQARGEAASQGWCSAWSIACGNAGVWESSFPAFLHLTPLQVEPCAESIAELYSLWMWLCVLKAAFFIL